MTMHQFLARNRIPVVVTTICVLLFVVYIIGAPQTFLSSGIYAALMGTIAFSGILAIAATFIVTLGEIDLSFPSIMGLSAYVFAYLYSTQGSFPLAAVACLCVGLVLGWLNGIIITKVGVPSIVLTIGTMFLWRGLIHVLVQGQSISLFEMDGTIWNSLMVGKIAGYLPAQFVWFLAIAIGLGLIYRKHRFGSHVLFVGDNAASARMVGIDTDMVKIKCFMLMGLMAAIAGLLSLAFNQSFFPTHGDSMLLPTLAAVFIGGTSVFGGKGTIWGTFMGVLIMGSLETGIVSLGLTGFWYQFIAGLTIVASVVSYALLLKKVG
jgi:simple sugar transport system permease protein